MSKEEKKNTGSRRFSKWYYILVGIIFIIHAFQQDPVNEIIIYVGIAFIIFAFFNDMTGAGWFKPRKGSALEKAGKKIFIQENSQKGQEGKTGKPEKKKD